MLSIPCYFLQPLISISNFYFFLDKINNNIKLAHTKMPFGSTKFLIDLPEYYVVWYNNKGFPKGS
jgi:hypothetical protein